MEDGTSYEQKPFCLDNSERNIWNKLKNLNEIRLDYDIFFGVLFDCCGQSFNATGRVSTALCLNLNFRFFQYYNFPRSLVLSRLETPDLIWIQRLLH